MFDISNKIAYDEMMVYGTPVRPPIDLPESCWFDIVDAESDGHWIKKEGVLTEHLLKQLQNLGADPAEIFLISPFRDVVRELEKIKWKAKLNEMTVGTVHTSQGKERDAVILVLGSHPKSNGARQWASQRPNLLNVAVSRAKRRLYVVGNYDTWRKMQYFNLCAGCLPVVSGVTWMAKRRSK